MLLVACLFDVSLLTQQSPINHAPTLKATVTTTRKFFTVLASVVIYDHTLSGQQWGGVVLVTAGLSLELFGKFRKSQVEHTTRLKSVE
jgi:drug/metabolite transporter (DMT)-like permease